MSISAGAGAGAESANSESMMEMNMTPLIDVMLVLIIMLIMTIPKQHHSVNLDMPAGKTSTIPEPLAVTIDVDFDGKLAWDGVDVPDRAALEAKLASVAAQATQPEVHLRPNKLAPYKFVAGLMASAQRLGVTRIGMIGNEQFQ